MEAQRIVTPLEHSASTTKARNVIERARTAAQVAAAHAGEVDAASRFPREAFAEIRKQRLLGMHVPASLEGEGATLADMSEVCFQLGQSCAATGLIFAMHQVKMGCIIRHAKGSAALERILRSIAKDELLLASSTTEGQSGGNVRSSEAAIEHDGEQVTLERKATVISYGSAADGLVTTARRSASAAASDQVLLVLLKKDYTLDRLQSWNTLGMRGTESEGFTLKVRAPAQQVMAEPYERIHSMTMVPYAHLLWGSVWAGIAAAATGKAQAFIRQALRQSGGQLPPGAPHYTEAASTLRTLRGVLASALRSYEAVMNDDKAVTALEFQTMITLTKVQVSELAVKTVLAALRATGLSGFRNDSEFSIGRHLRDVLSAPLMINNDRILQNLGMTSVMTPLPASLHS